MSSIRNSMDNSSSKGIEDQKCRPKWVKLYRSRNIPSNLSGIDKLNILGFYSMNSNYEFTDNLSQLRYLKIPQGQNVHFDLKVNANNTIKRRLRTNDVKIDSLLKWILAHRHDFNEINCPRIKEIVSFRGLLIKVMVTPYERYEGWTICATKYQGKIYLCKYETPEQVREEENKTEKQMQMCDWGYVFEQYMASEHPKQPPNINLPTNQNEEFCCLFQTRLGHHNLMYGAEMDSLSIDEKKIDITEPICSPKKLKEMLETGKAKFVELKTSADASRLHWEWKKVCRFKSLKWWCQCYMGGIEELVCGYRDDKGVVNNLQTFSVERLPQLGQDFWNPDVCIDYCTRFLDLVTNHVSNDPDKILWSFTWNPQQPDDIKIEHVVNDSPYFFLHNWFTDGIGSGLKRKAAASSSGTVQDSTTVEEKIRVEL